MEDLNRFPKIFQRIRARTEAASLVELMFVAVIGLIVLGMMMILYVGGHHNMTLGVASAEINSDARLAMDRMLRDLRWATQLEASRSISGTNYVTGNNEMVIKIPSIDANNKVISNTYDYVVYALDSSDPRQLRKIVDPNVASSRGSLNQTIANNINSFSLSSGGTPLGSIGSLSTVTAVEITINVNKTPLSNKPVSETLASVGELRNN